MLTQIKFKISAPSNFILHTNMSSLFHGYIMQNISSDYAEKMHISDLRPFTQSVVRENGEFYWYISSLNDEAYEKILLKILEKNEIYLEKKDVTIKINCEKQLQTSFENLFEENYFSIENNRLVCLDFLTPTAFKSCGRYIFLPDANLILSGLINKFDTFSDYTKVGDDQLKSEIYEKVSVRNFRISSSYFSVDGKKIPGFRGKVSLMVYGSDTLVKFVNMLVDFAEFAGIGIKTALGMGKIERGGLNE